MKHNKYKYVVTVCDGSEKVRFEFPQPMLATAFADICMDNLVKADRTYYEIGVKTEIVKVEEQKENEKPEEKAEEKVEKESE